MKLGNVGPKSRVNRARLEVGRSNPRPTPPDLDAVSRDGYEITEESRFNIEDAEAELEAEQSARAADAKWDAERSPEGDCNCRRCKP